MRRNSLSNFPAFLTLIVFLLAGCGTTTQTVEVTDRPTPPPPTVEAPITEAPMPASSALDTVRAGRFDTGKMWTFDNPPLDYLAETYRFRPDAAWFDKARLGALRFSTYCSASFVSPNGLVMTNHHCARQSVTDVTKPGEKLIEDGFFAATLDEEREVKDLYVDQLITIDDVTDEVYAGLPKTRDDEALADAREKKVEQLEKRLTSEAEARDSSLVVQVIALYNGGKYSAYTFKRYKDVRLVMAPELALGFFGGDADNFTYPRYNYDASFFRVYDDEGEPLASDTYFRWSKDGADEGELVFAVGSPGTTARLSTVSQLRFERDYAQPQMLDVLRKRAAIMEEYIEANPEKADSNDVRNTYFSIMNQIKSSEGQLGGLRDPYLIARRAAAERDLMTAIAGVDSLQTQFGDVIEKIELLQRSKEAIAPQSAAFTLFSTQIGSRILTRSYLAYIYAVSKRRGAPEDFLKDVREAAKDLEDLPREIEEQFISARLEEMQAALGADHPTVRGILQGAEPAEVASRIAESALIDSTGYYRLLDEGYLGSGDPSVAVAEAIVPLFITLSQQQSNFEAREENLNASLGRARFAVYGTAVPPDASFSLRINDGVVRGYAFNGTVAPAYTTFYGLYGHYYSYGAGSAWDLPEKWLDPPAEFDLETPFNLVSTNDITGGNSGSPLLNKNLEVVGLLFDSNIEALPNEYLFLDETGRALSVDSRGILEALDDLYDYDRLVVELTTGRLVPTEVEADAEEETVGG